ncbi:MAG: hypothetical protein CM15mP121_3300 [Bacteroidota bacterium]|nr:MAG: hypothetical protein CM15mP121_3300 [Bacteroidota bacterium]
MELGNRSKKEKCLFLKREHSANRRIGQLYYLEKAKKLFNKSDLGFDVLFVDGHTEKQMIPVVNYKDKKLPLLLTLFPHTGHVPLPYIPGYDVRPLISLKEKELFLNFAMKIAYFYSSTRCK